MITDEYKNKLLQNLTKMTTTPAYDYAEFSDVVSYEKEDIIDELATAFPYGYVQVGELQCKDSNNEPNGFSIVYGFYYTTSGQTGYAYRKGNIILFDDNMNKVALLTQYDSGTDFAPFVLLNIDEKGQLFGVDYMLRNGAYKNRFIMLNNISIKLPTQNYKAVLRQSYYVVDEDLAYENLHLLKYIIKDPNSSRYLFSNYTTEAMELHIEVGVSNEWTKYKGGTMPQNFTYVSSTTPYAVWDNEGNLTYVSYFLGYEGDVEDWNIYKATNSGTSINVSNALFNIDTIYNNQGVEEFRLNAGVLNWSIYRTFSIYTMNENEAYLMLGGTYYFNSQLKANYSVWKITNNQIEVAYEDGLEDADQRTIPMYCNLEYLNGNMLVKYYWQPITTGGDNAYKVKI